MSSPLLLPLKLLLIGIDLAITIVTFGWVKPLLALFQTTPLRSVPVSDDEPYRRAAPGRVNNLMTKPENGASTLYEMAAYSFEQFASNPCMKTREFKGMKSIKPPVKIFSEETTSLSYAEVGQKAYKFGAALRQEGLVPAPEVATLDAISTPCSLAIFENTCSEWMISALGAFSQSIVVTTIYATLGMDAVVSAVQDGVISAIVCNKKDVTKLLSKSGDMATLKTIIYTNDLVAKGDDMDFGPVPKGVKVVSFDEFCEFGDVNTLQLRTWK